MPPRRKPTSTRQKKADQQLRRAIKRGDAPPPEVKKSSKSRKTGPTGRPIAGRSSDTNAVKSVKKLQSTFVNLPQNFLEESKILASNLTLLRPVPDERAVFHLFDQELEERALEILTCPKRPKWRYDQSKLEVERNEEGLFERWLAQTDAAIERWQNSDDPKTSSSPMPRSTSYFERNLEVWRQLWRVTEISQIILVLLDSRCPLLHLPPSLISYLGDRKIILVLTKVDISGQARVSAWINYIHEHYPHLRIVQVESYIEKDGMADQGRKLYEPHIPQSFRQTLVNAIKDAHTEMLQPPERIKIDPERLKNWVSPVKREVDWEAVLHAEGDKVGLSVGGAAVPRTQSPEADRSENGEPEQRQEPTYLTIGLIGQPNVGKSSLLNALFGARKVRASKTPGKTKHFQTLYWTADVRLVDCPGLVMPNYVPMEMQVLSGILPISRVSAIPACIYHAAELVPLERIYNLVHPGTKSPPIEDKRTWRDGMKSDDQTKTPTTTPLPKWTAMDILTSYADQKGWVTAKAGRPDVNRAGNAILRALAEGRVGWAFWPSGTPLEEVASVSSPGQGIWIPRGDRIDQDSTEPESEGENRRAGFDSDDSEDEIEVSDYESDKEEDAEEVVATNLGRFGALAVSDEGNEIEASEEEK